MSTRLLNPYLNFPVGVGAEAMTFYADVLGGKLDVVRFADMGMEGPPEALMHGYLVTADGFVLMASDVGPDDTTSAGNISLCLGGDDEETMRGWFARLGEGGEVHVELAPQVWGALYGQLRDRFGITWMFNIERADAGQEAAQQQATS